MSSAHETAERRGLAPVIWFWGAVLIGGLLTYVLCGLDRWLYENQPAFENRASLAENKHATFSIPAETNGDPRIRGTLAAAERSLNGGQAR